MILMAWMQCLTYFLDHFPTLSCLLSCFLCWKHNQSLVAEAYSGQSEECPKNYVPSTQGLGWETQQKDEASQKMDALPHC